MDAAGGIAGVIHGAGVIEDKLLRDKTPESFDRVFGTKVESALTLRRKLDPAKLKFFSLYASITSRYGNRGQSDYAAANEVLSKLACDLDRRWPGRVVSVAWGPWAEVGMVADLEKHLVARGLKLIEPAVGAGFAVDEVIFGAKGEPEVVVAGGTEHAPKPLATRSRPAPNAEPVRSWDRGRGRSAEPAGMITAARANRRHSHPRIRNIPQRIPRVQRAGGTPAVPGSNHPMPSTLTDDRTRTFVPHSDRVGHGRYSSSARRRPRRFARPGPRGGGTR